ncbi:MAG: hypothetical protein D6816_14955, partial [Bacteroidetes bacterium]
NQNYCSPTITNSLFSGNKANGNYGGAIFVNSGAPTVINCTFGGNYGQNGGAIYNGNATTNVKNSIFWGNYSYQVYRGGGTLNINYSILQNSYGTISGNVGNLNANPLFVSLPSYASAPTTAGDFHIQFPSPALNIGTSSGAPATDYDGDTRPYGPGVDMGFDELEYPCPSSNVLYVDTDATGNDDGSSWTDAYNDLQDALLQARYCNNITQIWVAEGTYKPTSGTDRNISFEMVKGAAIYGGFAGTETALSQRNWVTHPTILSGNINNVNSAIDNSYQVIFNKSGDIDATAVLDGFTISDGYNYNIYNYANGSSTTASPTISNCKFSGSYNQGMSNYASSSSAVASPTITNCAFTGNRSYGIYNYAQNSGTCKPVILNATIAANYSYGIYNYRSGGTCQPTITNCIIWGNTNGIVNSSASPTVTYSIVQGGYSGTGNLSADPKFVDLPLYTSAPTNTGDYHLRLSSPAINAGTATGAPATDYDGDARPFDTDYDMGFDEAKFTCPSGSTLYVDIDATGSNNGSSWTDAYTDLQTAIDLASVCSGVTQVWVAEGTYKPTSGINRFVSFELVDGVALYGGFAGTETLFSQRDFNTHVTTLSGDIGTSASTDNSYHVFYNSGNNATAVLDGFTISDGYANGGGNNNNGGGMYNDKASPTINNCTFSDHFAVNGGAVYNYGYSTNGVASPDFTNCAFKGNLATGDGGAVYNYAYASGGKANPTFTNCVFSGNKANSEGGAIYDYGYYFGIASPTIMNCSFSGNSCYNTSSGSAMFNYGYYYGVANPVITNSIFWGNYGTQIYNYGGSPSVTYSIVQGGYSGTGNLNANPLFVSMPSYSSAPTTAGDLHIQFPSPALNVGTASGAPATDYDGDTRPYGPGVDMGFDELEYPCPSSNVIYVDTDATGNDDGSSWTDAYKDLQDALLRARYCSIITQIWVAEGTYKPTNTNNRGISFQMVKGVAIYGGFAGTETALTQRDWVANPTILSGNINNVNSATDNTYQVIYNNSGDIDATAVLDGFTVTDGYNYNIYNYANGSSTTASPTFRNCKFSGSYQFCMYNYAAGSSAVASPSITNCAFTGNRSYGIYNRAQSSGTCKPVIFNATIAANYNY